MNERIATPRDRSRMIVSGIRAALLTQGSATKVELSRMLGISFPTIGKFLAEMERDGELLPAGLDESSGGRRAQRYAYNPDHMLGLALFLEKNETNYMIFNCLGEAKAHGKTSSLLSEDVESLAVYIERIVAEHPNIRALSVGVPGAVNNGRIIFIPNYEAYHDLDLKSCLEGRLSIPVVVENDMNAAVLGFSDKKSDRVDPSLVYLYFGQNGPGSGILVNGDVVRGSTYFAGEVSFLPQYDDRNFYQALDRSRASTDGRPNEGQLIEGHPIEGHAIEGHLIEGHLIEGHLTEGQLDAVARLVASFAAILNPHAIIFCRDEADGTLLERIAERSAAYVPTEHLPRLTASDWRQDYLNGLQALGLQLMISGASV